ncbi:MAG: ABC transporter ATP-binding protein [Candidatus Jordarchaeaceae archaeon]
MIETENLTKFYGELKALDGLTIKVGTGITGFLGPNGAGKTTTIKIMLGLLKPSSGNVRVLGYDPAQEPLEIRKKVGFLPENPRPYKYMTGREFLHFIAKLRGLKTKQSTEEISKLLNQVGLAERAKDKISSYSKGMVQRLFLAQALIGDPELIILDEPTAGLDPVGREEILALLKELCKTGKSVFISSHILSEIERVCTRVIIIDRGRLVLEGDVDKIKEEFSSGRYKIKSDKPELIFKELTGKSYVKDVWIEGDTVVVMPNDDKTLRKAVLEISNNLDCDVFSLEKEIPSLQDVFISLIKRRGGKVE